MLSDYDSKIIKAINENFKLANQSIKGCYFKKYTDRLIKSHSISKRKVLEKIAENGTAMMLGSDCFITGQAKEVGINQATTLKTFCHEHDQTVFAPINNAKYIPRNKEQEFLFAMRTLARELHTKRAVTLSSETWNHGLDSLELDDFNYEQKA